MILRLLNLQGAIGLAAAAILAVMLGMARIDARHWKKQSARFEQLYRAATAAHATSVAAMRAAREQARAADAANSARVRSAQSAINERTSNDFEVRLADARARAQRMRDRAVAADGSGGGRDAPMPGLSAAPARIAQAPGQNRLSRPALGTDDALVATEQAIQLDALIAWVRAQAAVRTADPGR